MAEINTLAMKSFYFNCGGYFDGYNEMQVEVNDNKAVLEITPSILSGKSCVCKELSSDEWLTFSNAIMVKYHVCDWNEDYVDLDVMDGTQWEIKIVFIDGREKEINGSNDYPENWEEYLKFINSFVSFSEVKFY